MNKKIDTRDFERVDLLIQDEIDEALDVFRSKDFETRLRNRIAADDRAVAGKPFLMKIAVSAAAVLLLAGALVLIVTDRSPTPGPVDPGLFATVLSQFPSLSRSVAGPFPDPGEDGRISGAGRGFERILASAGRLEEKERGGPMARTIRLKVPALSMKRRMEILFKDKVIERALRLIAVKS